MSNRARLEYNPLKVVMQKYMLLFVLMWQTGVGMGVDEPALLLVLVNLVKAYIVYIKVKLRVLYIRQASDMLPHLRLVCALKLTNS